MTQQKPETHTIPPDGRPFAEQPRWRQDFPVDWPQDGYVARRDFVKFLVLISMAFTSGQFWVLVQQILRRHGEQPPRHEIARLETLPVGGTLLFDYPGPNEPRILVRLDEQTVVAYGQQCTHLSCPVIAQVKEGRLHCPCHEGWFDMGSGRPLAGPPRRPLPRVLLDVQDGVIYATGVEERTMSGTQG